MTKPSLLLKRLVAISSRAGLPPLVSQSNKEGLRNPWFLGLLGMVGVFFLVNFAFIVFAVISNPGLVDDNYYENGRNYEKHFISQRAQRQQLGWQTRLELPSTTIAGIPGMFRFSAADSLGLPLEQANVVLSAYRPSNAKDDFKQKLETVGPGIYQGKIRFPLPGVWDVHLIADYHGKRYSKQRRIQVNAAPR